MQPTPISPESLPRLPVQFARKYGPNFKALKENMPSSLCSRKIGELNVDCTFRHSQTQMGILNSFNSPAGILYVDLVFTQPKGCRLKDATVWFSLEETASQPDSPTIFRKFSARREPRSEERSHENGPTVTEAVPKTPLATRELAFTEQFGPSRLEGQPTTVTTKTTLDARLAPSVAGNSGGDIGAGRERTVDQTSRWIFTGTRLAGSRFVSNHWHRTLEWRLSEDDFQLQPTHSNTIQTAFTFLHDRKPFFLRVEIEVQLERKSDHLMYKVKDLLRAQDKSAVILVRPDESYRLQRRLDPVANGLRYQMEKRNLEGVGVQIPNALPVSFHEAPRVPADDTFMTENPVNAMLADGSSLPESQQPTLVGSETSERPTPLFLREHTPATTINQITRGSVLNRELSSERSPLEELQVEQKTQREVKPQALNVSSELATPKTMTPMVAKPVDRSAASQPVKENPAVNEHTEIAIQISQYPTLLSIFQWVIYINQFMVNIMAAISGNGFKKGAKVDQHS